MTDNESPRMIRAKLVGRCAYCGLDAVKLEREHVVPSCLYPAGSTAQRITVPACSRCNRGWSNDEAHFRNVLLVAGEPNAAVQELWIGKARRSFEQPDGWRRVQDLVEQMVPASPDYPGRYMIYPALDDRVTRVVRKVVRGLVHFHGIESAVPDARVAADVLKYRIPDGFMEAEDWHHRDSAVFQYWYSCYEDGEVASSWLLRFYERRTFIAWVTRA